MDKNSIFRWVIIIGLVFAFMQWGMPLLKGKSNGSEQSIALESYVNAPGFVGDSLEIGPDGKPNAPPEGELCTIAGKRFEAVLSSRGAGIVHYKLTDPQYAASEAADLSTTPDHERWRSLRTLFRDPADKRADDQVKYDRFNWQLEKQPNGCKFTYADDTVKIVKTISSSGRPFELDVETSVTNLTDSPKRHRFEIQEFAFRRNKETKGNLGRVSPFMTSLECANGKDVVRKTRDDFKKGGFSEQADRFAAITNTYFAQALVVDTEAQCNLLAEDWLLPGQSRDDDEAPTVYHANLVYPPKELGPGATATYHNVAVTGPKERGVLAHAAGGNKGLRDLINLGFFSPVAKILVGILLFFHDKVTGANWGLAIIVMTFCLRMLLFPLTWKSIKSSLGMRKLKPEIDALNVKYADDPQAKNMAMMELWKKHGVSPFGGCLPQLVQMPIWFAMYTTLQTAVEMYHVKFLWFHDLSAPDKLFILPIVIGGLYVVQTKIMPQQGMDPMQQKMMTYLMPAVFTVMMLFLPAALGVYMLTNSMLGIVQQLAIEQFAPSSGRPKGPSDIQVREASGEAGSNLRKGKARV